MDFPISLDLAFEDSVASIYRFRSLVVVQWNDTPTVGRIAPMSRALSSAVREQPGDVVVCALGGAHLMPADSASRAALQAGIDRLGGLCGAVTVIRGSGFQAAAMRAVLSGFALVMRQKYAVAFVASEAEAAAFITAKWPTSDRPLPERLSLADALARVRPKSG